MHKPSLLQHYTCKPTPWVHRLLGDAQCALVQRPNLKLVLEKVTQQVNYKAVLKFQRSGFEKQSPISLLLISTCLFSTLVAKLEMFGKTRSMLPSLRLFFFLFVLLRVTKCIIIYFQ